MNNFHLLLLISVSVCAEARYAKIEANLALTVIDDGPQKINAQLVQLCARETNMSMQELHQFQAQQLNNATEVVQCFTHCLYEQLGLMHDGVFVEQDFIGRLSVLSNPNMWAQHSCHSIHGANKCETAFKIHQCKQELKISELDLEQLKLETTTEPRVEQL